MGNDEDISFGNGTTRWNAQHFLDLAEFTASFAIAYDWMYDAWCVLYFQIVRHVHGS